MNNMLNMLSQLRQNPASMLKQFGIPAELMNDPEAIIRYMMNNGQITQAQYDNAVRMAGQIKNLMQ